MAVASKESEITQMDGELVTLTEGMAARDTQIQRLQQAVESLNQSLTEKDGEIKYFMLYVISIISILFILI